MTSWPVKVIDVELSEPINDIEGLREYVAVQILGRLFGRPVGMLTLPLHEGACHGVTIQRAFLEQCNWNILKNLVNLRLKSPVSMQGLDVDDLMQLTPPKPEAVSLTVTVAVCTRNRTNDLRRCLNSLTQLEYPHLQVLVVDNAPSDNATQQLVRQEFPDIRYVREPRPGLNWARNRAIIESEGEIIAFADDDVIVDPKWLDAIARAFNEDSEIMAVTGLVIPHELETRAQILFEEYGGFACGVERKWYSVDKNSGERTVSFYGAAGMFGTGANMAYRRSVFENIGMFDVALDVGTVTNGGGDIDMFFRVLHEGFSLVYEPAAIVRHRHRRDAESFYKQLGDHGIGFTSYLVRNALAYPTERWAVLRFWLRWLRQWHVQRLVRSLKGVEVFPRELIVAELLGYFKGLSRYPRARHEAAKIRRRFGPQKRQPNVNITEELAA